MSDASGGEPEDALIPSQSPPNQRTKKHFLKLTQRAPVLRQRKPRQVDPSDSSSAAGAEASAAAEEALNQGGEMGDSYEDEPLTAGQQAALEAAADAVAAAGEASFVLLTR